MRIFDGTMYRDATPEEENEHELIIRSPSDEAFEEEQPDEMEVLRRQVQALEQQSAMLVECLLEISEIIYE